MRQKIHLVAVGDVFIDRGLSEDPFLHVKETFREADIVFGNLEGAYTEHTDRAPSAGVPLVAHPKMAASLLNAGFTHLSLANNHILDAGHQGLVDTIRLLECRGIIPLGAGISLSHAHSAAITEVSGCRVGLLAYTCVFPRGYEARAAVPGVAAIRGRELYSAWEQNEWNPGLVPRIEIIPDENDLVRLRSGIETLKGQADFIVVSFHWGDFTRPYVVTPFERFLGHLAVDQGADVVFGHHHHLLRGFEFYNSRPILYGLGHFAFDLPDFSNRLAAAGYLVGRTEEEDRAQARRFGDYRLGPRDGYPLLPFHPHARLTCFANVIADRADMSTNISLVPCILGPENIPMPVVGEQAKEVLRYLEHCNEVEGLNGHVSHNTVEIGSISAYKIFA